MSMIETVVSLPQLLGDGSVKMEDWTITDVQTIIQNEGKSELDLYTLIHLPSGRLIRLNSRELLLNKEKNHE